MQHETNEPMSKKWQTIRKEPQLHLQKPTKSERKLEISEPNLWALVILEQWMEIVKDPKNQVWGMHHGWKKIKGRKLNAPFQITAT